MGGQAVRTVSFRTHESLNKKIYIFFGVGGASGLAVGRVIVYKKRSGLDLWGVLGWEKQQRVVS